MTSLLSPYRVRQQGSGEERGGPVVYWMSRDQRVADNWALLFAAEQAKARGVGLMVAFSLVPDFLGATIRQYGFMIRGLAQVEERLRRYNIPFVLHLGQPPATLPPFLRETNACLLVTEFDPLRIKQRWKEQVQGAISIPVFEVDAHNIVPSWEASTKQEYGARTIRPKIHRRLDEFLTDFPELPFFPETLRGPGVNWEAAWQSLEVDRGVAEVDFLEPGEDAARGVLDQFIQHRLERYVHRNDPNAPVLSNLSPYLHFGQISAQRVAFEILGSRAAAPSREAFLEELIVRRELADNFCCYNPNYDTVEGFPDWARKTLNVHRQDRRPAVYGLDVLESASTHDPLWNAAQVEMVVTGKMHGYMRMYWAKKILEWSVSPEAALAAAIFLNDRYELDGRDPNGYTGIAWSIGGVHDRPWFERPVFGQIRYMNAAGCARKFNVGEYVRRVEDIR